MMSRLLLVSAACTLTAALLMSPAAGCPYLSQRHHLTRPLLPSGHPPITTDQQRFSTHIGPECTQLAHNDFLPPSGQCVPDTNPPAWSPLMQDYPSPSDVPQHSWPSFYELDWTFWFIDQFTVVPPFDLAPPEYSSLTSGHTYYDASFQGGAQRERYDSRCINIFAQGPLQIGNFSCDFVILNAKKTAFLVLHDDRPSGAPECCLIGQPFHAPPQTFFQNVYLRKFSHQPTENVIVDWGGLTLPYAGLFAYGFHRTPFNYTIGPSNSTQLQTSEPYAFYFTGLNPDDTSSWQYQKFSNFNPSEQPVAGSFDLPDSCSTAQVCPGWQ